MRITVGPARWCSAASCPRATAATRGPSNAAEQNVPRNCSQYFLLPRMSRSNCLPNRGQRTATSRPSTFSSSADVQGDVAADQSAPQRKPFLPERRLLQAGSGVGRDRLAISAPSRRFPALAPADLLQALNRENDGQAARAVAKSFGARSSAPGGRMLWLRITPPQMPIAP